MPGRLRNTLADTDLWERNDIDNLRSNGIEVSDETAADLTPAQHDDINFYGTYSFDIDAERRREGHRPLRIPA